MHEVLHIPEILAIIVAHLEPGELAVSARVCSRWFLPCIEVLWEDVTISLSLKGLLMSMGFVVLNSDVCRKHSQNEWDRIYLYTSRTRILEYDKCHRRSISSRWTSTFLHPRHSIGGPLFPRVHTLRYYSQGKADNTFCNALTLQLPHLANLIANPSPFTKQYLGALGTAIQTVSSTLIKLDLHNDNQPLDDDDRGDSPDTVWREFSTTLKHCSNLEYFNVDDYRNPMPQIIFDTLGTFPYVKHVGGYFTNWIGRPNPDAFPSLESLTLFRLQSGELFRGQWFPPLPLQELELEADFEASVSSEVLEKASSRGHSLVTLKVHWVESVSYSNIKGLGNHHGLRYLALEVVSNVTVTDEDIDNLSAKLPELQEFTLAFHSPPCYLTLLSISHIARSCKKLIRITMPLNVTNIPTTFTAVSSNLVESGILLITHLVEPLQFDATAAATFLYRCFSQRRHPPSITSRPGSIGNAQWDEVDQVVKRLFASRDAI